MRFKKDSIVVRDDSTYPEGALVVDGLAPSGDLLAHPLGGGLHRAHFEIEGVDGKFAGWSDGRVWNGWAMPYFEFPEAEKVVAAMSSENGRHDVSGKEKEVSWD
jgi:hypothetical protein